MGFSITETGLDQALRVLENIPEFDELQPIRYYHERLEDTRHLISVAQDGSKLIGCKIGYDRFADGSFYSWLGGVLPEYRKAGIARALADHQEAWARRNGFRSIRFKTQNRHRAMLLFAIKNGFKIYNVKPKAELEHYRIELIKKL